MRARGIVFGLIMLVASAAAAQMSDDVIVRSYLARKLGLVSTSAIDMQFVAAANAQRTDQQTTSTSSAPNSLSNLEKTGIAEILSLAIERGKVSQTKDDKSATLSTTPYAVATFFGLPDTRQNWQEYKFARHLSLAGTFAKDVATTTDFSTFSTGEAKYAILGSRSPRDAALQADIRAKLDDAVQSALNTFSGSCSDFENTKFALAMLSDTFAKQFHAWRADHRDATQAQIDAELDTLLPNSQMDAASLGVFKTCIAATTGLNDVLIKDRDRMAQLISAYLADTKGPQLSVSYIYNRDLTISDYSGFKVLFSRDNSPGYSVNLNAEVDVNRSTHARVSPVGDPSPDVAPGAAIKRIRGYSVESGVTFGRFGNGRGDATFSLAWKRPDGINEKSTATGSGQINIHLNNMLTLPVALTYNSRATSTVKKGLQLTFGVTSLFDAFLSNLPH
jgi:hypothetical protein